MSLRDEVRELLTMSDDEDGYGALPEEVEPALDAYEEENGKINDKPEGTTCEEIAEAVYSQRKFWRGE